MPMSSQNTMKKNQKLKQPLDFIMSKNSEKYF